MLTSAHQEDRTAQEGALHSAPPSQNCGWCASSCQVCCLRHVSWSMKPYIIGCYSSWGSLVHSQIPDSKIGSTQNWHLEVGNHTPAIKASQRSLTRGVPYLCVPCLALFLTCVCASWLYVQLDVWGRGNSDIHPGRDFRWTRHFVSWNWNVCRWHFFLHKWWWSGVGAGSLIYPS